MKKYDFASSFLWLTVALIMICGYVIQTVTAVDDEYLKMFAAASGGLLIGIICVHCSKFSIYSLVKEKAPAFYIVGIFLMLLLKTSCGLSVNGTRRWLVWDDFRLRPAVVLLLGAILIIGYFSDKAVYAAYKLAIPILTVFIMIYYDDFFSSYLVMIVIMLVLSAVFENSLDKKIKWTLFWSLFGVVSVHIADYNIVFCLKNKNEFSTNFIASRIETLHSVGMFGTEGGPYSSLKFDGADPFCVLIENVGIAGIFAIIVCYLAFLASIIFIFVLVRSNGDVFGMFVTCAVGVQFCTLFILAFFTNFYYVSVIVTPPFLTVQGLNVLIYIFEIVILQSILKENRRLHGMPVKKLDDEILQ